MSTNNFDATRIYLAAGERINGTYQLGAINIIWSDRQLFVFDAAGTLTMKTPLPRRNRLRCLARAIALRWL